MTSNPITPPQRRDLELTRYNSIDGPHHGRDHGCCTGSTCIVDSVDDVLGPIKSPCRLAAVQDGSDGGAGRGERCGLNDVEGRDGALIVMLNAGGDGGSEAAGAADDHDCRPRMRESAMFRPDGFMKQGVCV